MPQKARANRLIDRISRRLFGNPLVTNVWRGEIVEEIVAMALEPEWNHCGSDYGSCDLLHRETGDRIQVKQAAARQSWGLSAGNPRFSIAHKTGEWVDGARWVAARSRNADILIFGWHPRTDDGADHRDPDQWRFYVVRESDLPDQKSLGLPAIQALAVECDWHRLKSAVDALPKVSVATRRMNAGSSPA